MLCHQSPFLRLSYLQLVTIHLPLHLVAETSRRGKSKQLSIKFAAWTRPNVPHGTSHWLQCGGPKSRRSTASSRTSINASYAPFNWNKMIQISRRSSINWLFSLPRIWTFSATRKGNLFSAPKLSFSLLAIASLGREQTLVRPRHPAQNLLRPLTVPSHLLR